ncbi:efflux transporter outer membrane subunit [Sphingobium sp. Ant17]|uniref:efflux transporter outer membrane subunit n=1 Tax=Sphingobium sp. Ant17 TaxID=1461752 RepID=UPI0004B17C05|nr:TolC family protein [Sphingobium sp. Ant17]|tara:strand:- start:5139 stop:6497 length:1359 start_codon:yes stop_codon:yes gene_type:complete
MRIISATVASILLTACATPHDPMPVIDTAAVPSAFLTGNRLSVEGDDLWWRGFDDPRLDAIIERALSDNLTIAAARDRLRAARAAVLAERADRVPSISGDIGIDGTGGVSDRLNASPAGGAGVLFNPDLNGRLSREIEAAAARAQASAYLLADARRLVVAATVQQYIDLRRSEAQLTLIEESTDLQQQTLRIVELRFGAGLSANLDVRRAAADLAQTEAQRGILLLQRSQAARALSVLLGEVPQPLPPASADQTIPSFSAGPPTGVPADLLRRRPDLLVAEANLAEAAATVGIEQADLLPALALTGRISIGDSFSLGLIDRLIGTVGAILDVPLFDGGRRRAEIAAARAEADARFNDYRQTLLDALREVENALVGIDSFSARSASLRDAIEQSESAFNQSNALYREGLTSLFDVLDAQRQLIGSRQSLIDSDAQIAFAIIDLYAAVGATTGT